jgi:hypothetical protein
VGKREAVDVLDPVSGTEDTPSESSGTIPDAGIGLSETVVSPKEASRTAVGVGEEVVSEVAGEALDVGGGGWAVTNGSGTSGIRSGIVRSNEEVGCTPSESDTGAGVEDERRQGV